MNFINKHVVYNGPNKQVTFVRAPHQEKFQLVNKNELVIPAFHSTLVTMITSHTSNMLAASLGAVLIY